LNPPEPPALAGSAFAEPWQAEAVAMKALLQGRGLFDAAEWSQALGAQLKAAELAGDAHAERYYDCWLAALEQLIAAKGLADAGHLQSLAAAWSRAAEATPHGRPIELANDPLGGA
jgi:nitrile hydratase accessory protein